MEIKYELTHLEYDSSSVEISDESFSNGFTEIEKLINEYAKIGLRPLVGERYIPMTDGFDTSVEVTSICFCEHKIMIECKCI